MTDRQLDLKALGEAVDAAMTMQPKPSTQITVGDTVIAWDADNPVTYGGPDEYGMSTVWVIGIGTGGMTVKCPPDRVAPAGTPLADPKDPRIRISKRHGPSWLGNWWLEVPGSGSWHKTKRAATAEGQRRLAISDWHTARGGRAQ